MICLIIALLKLETIYYEPYYNFQTFHIPEKNSIELFILVWSSNLDNVTWSMWNESYFPLKTAGYLNGCFITLNFTEWLKLFHMISLQQKKANTGSNIF